MFNWIAAKLSRIAQVDEKESNGLRIASRKDSLLFQTDVLPITVRQSLRWNWFENWYWYVIDFARRLVYDNGVAVFNFGKHKGKSVIEVLKGEPQYYDWKMKGDFPLHTKQKLTEILNKSILNK